MFKKNMKKLMYIVLALLLAACEKSIIDEKTGQDGGRGQGRGGGYAG